MTYLVTLPMNYLSILAWGEIEAGNDYFMNQQHGLPSDQILQYERQEEMPASCIRKFTEMPPMQVLSPYRRIPIKLPEIKIQEPMPDELPVATSSSTRRLSSPMSGDRHLQGRTPTVMNHSPEPTHQEADNPLNHCNPLQDPQGGHSHASPPRKSHPAPPAPWVLTTGDIAPYDDFKPKILKEVDDFNGDSNNISCFFLKCELHFNLFNHTFGYHSHKVIFCVS